MPKDVRVDLTAGQVLRVYSPTNLRGGINSSKRTATLTASGTYVEPVPPDPVPVVTASSAVPSKTGAVITWTVSEKATGQVRYGPNYSLSTTAETSFNYSTHQQTITGLTPCTTYAYRVVGKDSAGQPYSKDGSFVSLCEDTVPGGGTPAPPVVPRPSPDPDPGEFPPTGSMTYSAGNSDARPSYMGTITDSTTGATVMRISNVHLRRNSYVSQVSFSKDGTRLMFYPNLGGDYTQHLRLLNGQTYADIGEMQSGTDFAHFSNLSNTLIYGTHNAAGTIKTNAGDLGGWTNHATISGWPFLSFNYGMLSRQDWVALIANSASDESGTWRVIVYDLPNKLIKGYVNPGFQPSSAQLSLDGNYVQINRQANGAEYMYRVPGADQAMAPMSGGTYGSGGLIRTYGSHMCMAELVDGTPVSVSLAEGGIIRRCDNNAPTDLFPGPTTTFNSGSGGHLSYTNRDYPGWVVASTGVATGNPGHDQIVAINLDDPTETKTFAEAHACRVSSPTQYHATPFAIANRNMTAVVWGSAWDGNENTEVYAFAAWMP